MLKNKKAIELSLENIIGLVVVAFILVGLFMFSENIINLLIERADVRTINNFERLSSEITGLKEGESVSVPYSMGEAYKLTSSAEDKECLQGCICLCKIGPKGCLEKVYERKCYGFPIEIDTGQITQWEVSVVQNLNLKKENNKMIIGNIRGIACEKYDSATCGKIPGCYITEILSVVSCKRCNNLLSCSDYALSEATLNEKTLPNSKQQILPNLKDQCEQNKCGLQNVDCKWDSGKNECIDCKTFDCSTKDQNDCSICSQCTWSNNGCKVVGAVAARQ